MTESNDLNLNLPQKRTFEGKASILRRFISFIIDLLIINIFIISPFRKVIEKIIGNNKSISQITYMLENNPSLINQLSIVLLFISILMLFYFIYCEYKFNQTAGQKLMKIYVKSELKNKRIYQYLLSNVFILPFFPFIILWIIDPIYLLISKNSKRFSEKFAKLRTIQINEID